MKISIVIPALNEEAGIGLVIDQIPKEKLQGSGYQVEIIVVDNGSTDRTAEIAAAKGAIVIAQPLRGYGNAYKAGFDNATGDIVVTGDADMTYPFDHTQDLVEYLLTNDLEFLNTNRLEKLNPGLVARIHALGTIILTKMMNVFFKCPFYDSQSGMWIFKRYVWDGITVESSGMPFSQEIKIEAFTRGFRCAEVLIEYRARVGESKLDTFNDGLRTMMQLFDKYFALKFSQKRKRLRQTANLPGSVQIKNILIVSHYYPPHVGGIEMVARNQAKFLARSGYNVTVVTSKTDKIEKEIDDEDGVRLVHIKAINVFERFGIPFPIFSLKIFSVLWSEIRDADIIHIHDVFYQTSWIACFFAYLKRKPSFLTQHVALVQYPNKFVMLLQTLVYKIFGNPIFGYSKKIITYNDNVKTFVTKQCTEVGKVVEIRNGIDLSLFHPEENKTKATLRSEFGLPSDRPVVLFVGRMVPKKGIDIVYGAADEKYEIVFVGSGGIPQRWEKSSHIHYFDSLSQEKLAELYRASDIFVFPSNGEVFTLTMQEAMASGLPIITSDEPAYREYDIRRDLIGFIEPTVEELRANIHRILNDKKLYEQMRNYSVELAHQWFNRDDNIGQIIKLYSETDSSSNVARIVTTSWDDGRVLDLRLAELLKKYDIKGTFYIAPQNWEVEKSELLNDEQIRCMSNDFEIGAHTMTHARLRKLDRESINREVMESKIYLEKILGKNVKSFSYPYGSYNLEIANQVKESGFLFARTIKAFSFDLDRNPYTTPTSIHAFNQWVDLWRIAKFVRFNPGEFLRYCRHWDLLAMAMFDRVEKNGGIFHLWGHGWDIERFNDWERLEVVLRHISGHKNVQYLINSELI